ncbi:MAG TPA: ferritin-like domain-containing protein [Burkholderiaceae bacterium]|nr:ferritin-like domain-containing protein [Burkholderiaceae bacterium]
MESTSLGLNRTGGARIPDAVAAMVDATDQLSPFSAIDMAELEAQKGRYIGEAEPVGSIPPPLSVKGAAKAGVAKLKGGHPSLLLDKIGERLAFERTGTRLYEALAVKYQCARALDADALPLAKPPTDGASAPAESPGETIMRIRSEELEHFRMLVQAMSSLGGDPTAMTPCADVSAVASSGLMQVLNDPRTTLAQCLSAVLTAELTDTAGWELLAALADEAGESDLAGQFLGAYAQEQEHLITIKGWLSALMSAPNAAV